MGWLELSNSDEITLFNVRETATLSDQSMIRYARIKYTGSVLKPKLVAHSKVELKAKQT